MKFFKLYRYDLRQGLAAKPVKWLIIGALAGFIFFCFCLDVFHIFYFDVTGFGGINILGLSFGDVVLTQLGGILPPDINSVVQEFIFPVKWLFFHILILFFTLGYTSGDLTRCGMQVITRTGNKTRWWLSKCLWNLTAATSYYVVGIGVLYILSALTGKAPSMALNNTIFLGFFGEPLPAWASSGRAMFTALCVTPCAAGLALNLVQMTLTLYIKPMIAFLLICAYWIAGVFYVHPMFLSNYALSVRNRAVGIYPLTNTGGLVLSAAVAVCAVIIGCIRMQKMDLIGQDG